MNNNEKISDKKLAPIMIDKVSDRELVSLMVDEINSALDAIESAIQQDREPIGQEIYTRELWEEAIRSQGPFLPFHGEADTETQSIVFDEDVIAAAKNFLLGPVGAWRNKAIVAETKTFSSLEDLKSNILKEAEQKDMVLYKTYTSEKIEFEEGTFKRKDGPKITLYNWRGSFLDKE